MIRANFKFDPTIKYERKGDSELRRSLNYLNAIGLKSYNLLQSCKIAGKISYLAPMAPVINPLGKVVGGVSRASQVINFAFSAEALGSKMSVSTVVGVAGKGMAIATWLSQIERLGFSVRVASALNSSCLALALLSPTIGLISHLHEEGISAFYGVECYKTSYKVGVALLAVYLYVMTLTLSAQVNLLLMSANIAISLI
jgi:hypothetical protein